MSALLEVVLPVFLVIGFGYAAAKAGLFPDGAVDGVMKFAQHFAVPCLLFTAIANIDLSSGFNAPLLLSFYVGATTGFLIGTLGAHYIFKRDWQDSIAIGFCCLFSNSLLLGLPISERAYGPESLATNYSIIAIHSPFCFCLAITAMEIVRGKGVGGRKMLASILSAMFRNALIVGIGLGFIVNISGVTLPIVLADAIDMMVRAALPAALFGLGGVLTRYTPEGDMKTIFFVIVISLVVHPIIVLVMANIFGLSQQVIRNAVITAAMAPGVNTYIFANFYGRARRVAASSVLIGTAVSVPTIWIWLHILG
ncbi:AEC family transporter [Qingshengfaniella alkalisoli]|uniref:AEC family transporter n=1 Tax=Qingshengfaniella alkalisoli TaxID=2599296 RepID=A0A5B8IVF7_9RHOB|nr:AEC family transporter [Qingshengfaniella alkalisoli]QDY68478.1 AEC family transporter [Qingshengfaniella alkalisoli]